METLKEFLARTAQGQITDSLELEALVVESWNEFSCGTDDGGMQADKLSGRIEDVLWNPPTLEFTIARHGGTVLGSSREQLQRWSIDTEKGTARYHAAGHRQVRAQQARVDVRPLATELARKIVNEDEDERLSWLKDGRVLVRTGVLFPSGSAAHETVAGRRRKFRNELRTRLESAGWKETSPNRYLRSTSSDVQS